MRPRVRVWEPSFAEINNYQEPKLSKELYTWLDTIYDSRIDSTVAILYDENGRTFRRQLFEITVEPKEKEYTYEDL